MKKSFKYLFILLGSILLILVTIRVLFWQSKADSEKSGFLKTNQTYDFAEEYNKNTSDVWMEKSVSLNKAGDFNKGFEYLDKAVQLEPKKHLGYRGWIRLRKIRDYDKALIDFDRLDSLTPNVVDAPWGEDINFLRGECYFGNKEYAKAVQFFNLSIKTQGEDWADIQTFVYLGLCEYQLGNYNKAVLEFKRALYQSENVCEAHFGIARTYRKLNNNELAKEHIQKAETTIAYKRDDPYNEFLNEIYRSEILELKAQLREMDF